MNLSTTSGMGILKVNWMNKIVNGKQKQSFNDRIKVDIHNQELVKDHELLLVHSGMSLFRCWGRRTGQVTCEYWHWVTTSFCFSYHQMWQSEQLICSWINSSSFVQWQHGAHCSFPSFVNIHLHPYLLMKERKPSPSKQQKRCSWLNYISLLTTNPPGSFTQSFSNKIWQKQSCLCENWGRFLVVQTVNAES